jgi:hypothetical protein
VDIASFGGLVASLFVALSGLVQWTISQPGIADIPDLTRALHFLIFATGGPGYTVPVGLLFAGISIPALAMRLMPRWLCALGVVLGVIGELSSLSLMIPGALFLIPLTRFPGFLWLIAAGFAMPAARPARNCRVGSHTPPEIPLPAGEAVGASPATG